jgi:hypothetical protein
MTSANLDIQAASLNSIDSPASSRFLWRPQLPTRPCPSRGGDVACLGAAINPANANGEADTINLETGTYTLTAVDNDPDGPNGPRDPRGDPAPGKLRRHPSGSHEAAVWACGGPSDQGLWSARGKSSGTCRGVIGKTGRGTPLNSALTTEGAPFEGQRVAPTA